MAVPVGIGNLFSEHIPVFVVGTLGGVRYGSVGAAGDLLCAEPLGHFAEIHGAGVAVPADLGAEGLCQDAYGQIGGAVENKRFHGAAVGIHKFNGRAVLDDFHAAVIYGDVLDGPACGRRAAALVHRAAVGKTHRFCGAVPGDLEAQGVCRGRERHICGAVKDERLNARTGGVYGHYAVPVHHHPDGPVGYLHGLCPVPRGCGRQSQRQGKRQRQGGDQEFSRFSHGFTIPVLIFQRYCKFTGNLRILHSSAPVNRA